MLVSVFHSAGEQSPCREVPMRPRGGDDAAAMPKPSAAALPGLRDLVSASLDEES